MKNPRVVAYLRVSTAAQDFAAQKHAIAAYCGRRGWRVLKHYQEKKPGANAPRTELDQLLQDARAGKFDCVVIYKLDRLGRSSGHLAQIVEELAKLAIALVSVTEGFDTSDENPMGHAIMKIIAVVGELDRARIRERSADGLKAARARGVRLGRPPVSNKIKKQILELRAQREQYSWGFGRPPSMRAIAEKLGVSVGTVAGVVAAATNAGNRSKSIPAKNELSRRRRRRAH